MRSKIPDLSFFLKLQNSDPEFADAFSTLINNLHLLYSQDSPKTLLITSAKPLEGKTTVVVNLGILFAREGKKVLLIDGDIRRPQLHSIFHLRNEDGLANILKKNDSQSRPTHPLDLVFEPEESCGTLHVMPSGPYPKNLSELLKSDEFKNALESLKETFDIIIFDAPPILAVDDGLLLAQLVDGVILVLNTGVVTEGEAKRTKSRLESSAGKILGVILNRFDEKKHGASLHSFFNHYAIPSKI